jgi:hypothetical protein
LSLELNFHDLYFASVPIKLALAGELNAKHGARLAAAPEISSLLARVEEAATGLGQVMESMAMPALCRECGSRPAGGCCSLEMTNETDSILLLANMLLGIAVAVQRDDGIECSFLGPRGCILRLKPIFCLNYNCAGIHAANSPATLATLGQAASRLLNLQTDLEDAILEQLPTLLVDK